MVKPLVRVGLPVLVLLAYAASGVASPVSVEVANRATATGAASELLSDVVLPPGSLEVSSEPPGDEGDLSRPASFSVFAAQVDLPRFWTTSASPDDALASIEAHLPAERRVGDYGSGPAQRFATYGFPTTSPGVIRIEELTLDAVRLSDGSTGVRADAEVVYVAPRRPGQQIPRAARILQIRVSSVSGRRLRSLTVTRRSVITHLARVLDSLPFEESRPPVIPCPKTRTSPIDTFTFLARPTGPVLARLSEAADTPTMAGPCEPAYLSVRGHREPPILDGGQLLRRASRLLGVRLST